MNDLSGKRILVTGASSGIGRACAVELASLGAELVLLARSEERLAATRDLLAGSGHQILPFDLAQVEAIASLPDLTNARERPFSGLVHSAGICPLVPLAAVSPAVIHSTMQVNFDSFMELSRLFTSPEHFAGAGGSLVAISAVASMGGWPSGSAYCSSKAALDAVVRVLALELAGRKIRVNTICPGYIQTEMLASTNSEAGHTDSERDAFQPLGLGEAADVAHAVAFLMSDASRFITGTNMIVDGGVFAKRS